MHKVWCCSEQVPYCSRSSVKFQGHTAQKIDFDPNWPFLDCNSSLNSPMAMKWCTKLEETSKRYPIVFRSHSSNFNVTWEKIAQIGRIGTVTPVWIHGWLWGIEEVLLFFNVIVQISRSQRTKKCWFLPKLRISGLQLQFEFTDGFQMMHTAWRSIAEVPYCFWRSSMKFRGHTGWKIDDLKPIWVRLLGRSPLSNPGHLPCFVSIILYSSPFVGDVGRVHRRIYRDYGILLGKVSKY